MTTQNTKHIPWGILFFRYLFPHNWSQQTRLKVYRVAIVFLTFWTYTFFHMSRKAISVVKTVFLNCTDHEHDDEENDFHNATCTSFISEVDGLDKNEATQLEGWLDTSFLFSYAFFMFISGFVAERMDLRYFLSIGMLFSGIFVFLLGFAKVAGIHKIAYFIGMQVLGGAFQAFGWPGVVTVMANWFGKGKKGLLFGIWNSHTSVGNILGGILAGIFVEDDWAYSFIVPGSIIAVGGFIIWLVLVPRPEDVNLSSDLSVYYNQRSAQDISRPGEHTPLLQSPEFSDEEESFEPEVRVVSPQQQPNNRIPPTESNQQNHEETAISFLGALKIPGVIEFSLCLFFAKLVSYTFLYWLPQLISESGIPDESAAYLSTLFDVGGIVGGIVAGFFNDRFGKPAVTCAIMLIIAIPSLFGYDSFGHSCPLKVDDNGDLIKNGCYSGTVGLLLFVGLMVNGPYALITTAVSADLGVHPSLQGSSKALATVTAIIDGTGSIGAAIGPFLAGALEGAKDGPKKVFYMLMAADVLALLFLARLVYKEIQSILQSRRGRRRDEMYIEQQ